MTYEELKQAVQDYLETDEATFVSQIPTFVRAVENRVYNDVNIPALRKNSTGSMIIGDKYLHMPIDFLAPYSVAVISPDTGAYRYCQYKDVNLIREIYPSPSVQGLPRYFGLFDPETMIFGPTPDKAYNVELHYYHYPDSLVDSGASWLATNFPAVVLYGVISEGYRFQKGDAVQQKQYDDQYENAINFLRKTAEGRISNDAYSNNQPQPKMPLGE